MKRPALLLAVTLCLQACARSSPTPVPTRPPATCSELDAAWSQADWPLVITALASLEAQGQTCGADSLTAKHYSALINYGAALEASGLTPLAVDQYRNALGVDGRGREAIAALRRLNALPAPTTAPCLPDQKVPPYKPAGDDGAFISPLGQGFGLAGQPWPIYGINYYPRSSPWDRFLPELNLNEVDEDWSLIHAAGFNTVRIFLWYDPLFTCEPETATPNAAAVAQLDALLALAAQHDLRLIVTLNDLPDLAFRPLYTDWPRYDAQTAWLVARYKDEPTILAWDLRNEADLDYGASGYHTVVATQAEVLAWLNHASGIVREQEPQQLITAGWWGDASETLPAVDFLSFHHWGTADELQGRLGGLSQQYDRPILVEELGYHSWAGAPQNARDEARQAQLLDEALDVLSTQGNIGWAVWAAFDFPPSASQTEGYEHHFGLWRIDGSPKPALAAAQAHMPATP